MDSVRIGSRILQSIVITFLEKTIRNKLGIDTDISFNDAPWYERDDDGMCHIHLNADILVSDTDFDKLLRF